MYNHPETARSRRNSGSTWVEPEVQTLVIGAGVVGLACAVALADRGREVLLLERNGAVGEETSARSSEVIHAGLYYPPGSNKARWCVTGKARLYDYCRARAVPSRRVGKLIVASQPDDRTMVQKLLQRGRDNGVRDLSLLNQSEAQGLEPDIYCDCAIHSPSSGIVDSHQLMLSLLGELETLGGSLCQHARVISLQSDPSPSGQHRVLVAAGPDKMRVKTREIVNCAGHQAVALARSVAGSAAHNLPNAAFSRGNYFRLRGKAPFSRLIYPLPEPGGLGIHLTLDMAGRVRFGPDVEAIPGPEAGYLVDSRRAKPFYDRIRCYWPALPDRSLIPDYAGIRPKIIRPGKDFMDFEMLGPGHHGVSGLVHCLGIESPGLTACLAIADAVVEQLECRY